jgi:hypothetical protein
MLELKDRCSSSVWIVVALILLIALAGLYVLSVGPYARYCCGDHPEPHWGVTFYAPLNWTISRSRTAEESWRWYVTLWITTDFPEEFE